MKLSLIDSKYHSRIIRHWPLLCALLFLLVPPSHSQTTPTDVPSGFMPGIISDYAGDGKTDFGFSDGSLPTQVQIVGGMTATDSQGNVYIALQSNGHAIYMVYGGKSIPTALANVTTKATPQVTPQKGRIYEIAQGTCNGVGTCEEGQTLDKIGFNLISGLAIDSQDNLYYSDSGFFNIYVNDVVRKVDATTSIVTTVAGQVGVASPTSCAASANPGACIGDGGLATKATFSLPLDIKLDSYGNLYIQDAVDWVIRVVYTGSQPPPILAAEGISNIQKNYIYTVAGQVQNYCSAEGCGDGGSALSAQIDSPSGMTLAVDAAGNLYIADTDYNNYNNNLIQSAYIRVVYAGGAVPPLLNQYLNPNGGNNVTPTNGYIYPVTGYGANTQYVNCTSAGCGDGGLAANVEFGAPQGSSQLYMTVDDLGNLYIADYYGPAVRKIDTSGYASTIAGIDDPTLSTPATCSALSTAPNFSADCLASNAALTIPTYISFDAQNNLYISDADIVWEVVPLLKQNLSFPTFDPATVTYGVNPITLDATSDTTTPIQYSVSSSTPSGIGTINGSQLSIGGAGSITVTASQPQTDVYLATTSSPQILTVNPSPTLVVTANDEPLTPAQFAQFNLSTGFSASYSGLVHGDTASTFAHTGAPGFTTTATSSASCGIAYPITPSIGTLTSPNYDVASASFVPGTLSITGTTAQTINFPAFSSAVTYGKTASVQLGATASSGGAVTYTVVSGPGAIAKGSSTLTINGAGSIVVQAIQTGTCANAASPAVTQTLTVNPAPLTVTGPTVTTTYGTVLDTTTFPAATITGFVSPDTQASVLTGGAKYSIASTTPNAGTYSITVSQGTLQLDPGAAANYTFATFANSSLIVNQATQTINFNPIPSAQTYGNYPTATAVATSGLPVTLTATAPSTFQLGNNNLHVASAPATLYLIGVGTVTVTATQAGDSNHLPAASVSQTLNVGQAPLDIAAVSVSREQGAPNPTFTYGIGGNPGTGGFVYGDTDIPSVVSGVPVLTTTATQASSPGTYSIVVDTSAMTAANYYFVPINGTLTVTPPGTITLTTTPTSLTIQRGLSGQATVIIAPSPAYQYGQVVPAYQGTVTLTCGAVPANVTCTISPSTYTFTGPYYSSGYEYPAKGTITINTTAATVVGANASQKSNVSLAGFLIPGALAGLFLVFARKRVAKIATFWSLCALLALGIGTTLAITSCGGSVNTTAATGTQTITITGSGTTPSGGTVTATVPLTVTIQ